MRRSRTFFASAFAATILSGCGGGETGPDPIPAAPTSLTAVAIDAGRVELRWVDMSADETAFVVERSPAGGDWSRLVQVGANIAFAVDVSVEPLTSYQYRVMAASPAGSSNPSNVASVSTPADEPEVVTGLLPAGRVGLEYTYTLEATKGDGSYRWEVTTGPLPAGLSLADDGVLSGTAEIPGVQPFTVAVHSAGLFDVKSFSMTVLGILEIVTQGVIKAELGVDNALQLESTGGDGENTWTLTAGALPEGMTLDAVAGVFHGAPTALGAYDVSVEVSSGDGQVASADLTIEVEIGPVRITSAELDQARVAVDYDQGVEALGGVGPYTWSVTDGGLPDGLELDEFTGLISGIPMASGVAGFTVTATDTEARTADQELSIQVCEGALALAVGDRWIRPFPDNGCGTVLGDSPATYRVGVISRRVDEGVDPVPGGLQVMATAGEPGDAFPAASPRRDRREDLRGRYEEIEPGLEEMIRATERLHIQLREEELRELPNMSGGPPSVMGPPPSPGRRLAIAAASTEPDTLRPLRVIDPEVGQRIVVTARLRGVSPSIYYYEDTGIAGSDLATDEEVQRLLDYYEANGKPLIDNAFGGLGPPGTTNNFKRLGIPVDLPADDIDENGGRVIVFQVRPSLMLSGAAAYVSSCDRRPRPENYNAGDFSCNGSNEAEITYILRPGPSFFFLGTTVHEVKHISSHGYAVFGGRGFNPSWIEEGTAEISKEKSSRDAAGLLDGVEAGYFDIYPCEGCSPTAETYGMRTVNIRARNFLRASPVSGIIGNPSPNPNGSTFYGASWLFHRFLADNYAGGDEDALFHALNTGGRGISQIEAVIGKGLEELFTEFISAIAVEGEADARVVAEKRFWSYDYADIASRFSGRWPYPHATALFENGEWPVTDLVNGVEYGVQYTAPNFFEFSTFGGGPSLRLDVTSLFREALEADDEVELVLTRIR